MAKIPNAVASATATVEATVIRANADPTTAAPAADEGEGAAGGALGPFLSEIATPEAAVAALKAKTGILHTLVHNVGHYSSVAFNDIEQLMADIRWLTAYIRSKV